MKLTSHWTDRTWTEGSRLASLVALAAMPSYTELRKTNHFYYFIKFTLNVYSMLFSVSFW